MSLWTRPSRPPERLGWEAGAVGAPDMGGRKAQGGWTCQGFFPSEVRNPMLRPESPQTDPSIDPESGHSGTTRSDGYAPVRIIASAATHAATHGDVFTRQLHTERWTLHCLKLLLCLDY